ncbi:hypothetical protein ACQBAR_01370 [Propionibacteriaceae bacterium Y1685]
MSDPSPYDPHGIGAPSESGPSQWQEAGGWTPPSAPPGWTPPAPAARRRPWFTVPLIILVALVVIAAGAVTVWQFTRPAQDPTVVEGLTERPSLLWSYSLGEGVTGRPEPVGADRALVVPQLDGKTGPVPLAMISLTDGKELWRSEISPAGEVYVTGGQIPGTDYVYLMEHHLTDETPSVLTVRAADDGAVVATRELTEVVGVSAAEGSLFLFGLERLARLDPEKLDTPLWEVDHHFSEWGDGGLHVTVRGGYALLTFGMADTTFSTLGTVVSAHALADGSTPPWQPTEGGTMLITDEGRVLMTHNEDGAELTGLDEKGADQWTIDVKPGLAYANGNALLVGEYSQDFAETEWQRYDPATGKALWASPLSTSPSAGVADLGDVLVATNPEAPELIMVDPQTGAAGVQFRGEGHQTAYFEGEDKVFVASAKEPSEMVEPDGSVNSPNGIRLQAVPTDGNPGLVQPDWTLELPGAIRVLQCGSHLIVVDTGSGSINGIG